MPANNYNGFLNPTKQHVCEDSICDLIMLDWNSLYVHWGGWGDTVIPCNKQAPLWAISSTKAQDGHYPLKFQVYLPSGKQTGQLNIHRWYLNFPWNLSFIGNFPARHVWWHQADVRSSSFWAIHFPGKVTRKFAKLPTLFSRAGTVPIPGLAAMPKEWKAGHPFLQHELRHHWPRWCRKVPTSSKLTRSS